MLTLTPPGGAPKVAGGCGSGTPARPTTPAGLAFLDTLGVALADDPPPAADAPGLAKLARVGIGPGLAPERAGLTPDALAALVAGVTSSAAALPGLVRSAQNAQAAKGGGWTDPAADIGDYGTDYTYRAAVALAGLGANTRPEAIYPTAYLDGDGQPLDGSNTYTLTFRRGQAPPARAFWSLTAYDGQGYLVANAARRYAVGDSHPPLVRGADGAIRIVLSATRPAAEDVNWLPVPRGAFRLNLRLYRPAGAALSHAWVPPPVRRVTG
jgi:hypothetical protein